MKNIYKIFKTQLLLAVVLFGALVSFAQPVVQVPANCTVVEAGTGVGTILGLGGKVGNNGIVTMPDPSGGGKFSVPSTTIVGSWTLKGDLSTGTPLKPYGTPLQSAGSVILLEIYTYNKTVRTPSEIGTDPVLARSKGTVTIVYNPTPSCSPSITFQVFKTYNNYDRPTASYVPSMVGPSCIKPNTQYTYSVDQIASDNIEDNIGVDTYYWTIGGMTVNNSYTSADKSSITFITPGPTLPAGNLDIKCCYGRANLWDGNARTCVNLPLKGIPILPSITPTLNLLPSQANCITTGSAPVSYTILDNPAYTYDWTSSESTWLMTQSLTGTTRTFKIDFNGSNNPGKVTLKINSNCDPVEFTFQINRTLATGLGITAIGGTAPVTCLTAATSYSLPQSALGNFTTWKIDTIPPLVPPATLPTGAPTVTNASTAPNSTTLVTPGTASGQFSLVATSNTATTCTSATTRITINIPLAKPLFTIGTPSCVLKNINITTIAVSPVTGATSYTWTLPSGWSFPSGSSTNATANPTFIVDAAATGTFGALSVVANNGTGCNSAPASKIINYIAVTLTSNTALDAPDQYYVNSCGGYARWYLSGSATPLANPAPLGSNYSFSGAASNTLLLGGNATQPSTVCAKVYTDATYATLVATVCATTVGSHSLRQAATTSITDTKEVIDGVSIFPNPNNGVFFVKVENIKEVATATLKDFSGNEVATYSLKKGTNKLGNEELSKGTYILTIKVDGKQETRQVIIK